VTKIRKRCERILAAVMVICEQYLISTSACVLCPGESVPVNKTSIPRLRDVVYDPKEDVTHTLFCGTKVSILQQCRLVTWLVCLNYASLPDIDFGKFLIFRYRTNVIIMIIIIIIIIIIKVLLAHTIKFWPTSSYHSRFYLGFFILLLHEGRQ